MHGRLNIVYEGHWAKIKLIYLIPNTDLLVTTSESNIKIWDLQYYECIKNMNEHTGLLVFLQVCHHNKHNLVSISQNREYKNWNYTTGVVEKSFVFDLKDNIVAVDINKRTDLCYLAMSN